MAKIKQTSKLLIVFTLILSSVILAAIFQNVNAIETDVDVKISFEQETDNIEMCSTYATIKEYDFYEQDSRFTHDQTLVSISDLQKMNLNSSDMLDSNVTEIINVSRDITEYTTSETLDTNILLDLNYTLYDYENYTSNEENSTLLGILEGGSIESVAEIDDNSLIIGGLSYIESATLNHGSSPDSLSETRFTDGNSYMMTAESLTDPVRDIIDVEFQLDYLYNDKIQYSVSTSQNIEAQHLTIYYYYDWATSDYDHFTIDHPSELSGVFEVDESRELEFIKIEHYGVTDHTLSIDSFVGIIDNYNLGFNTSIYFNNSHVESDVIIKTNYEISSGVGTITINEIEFDLDTNEFSIDFPESREVNITFETTMDSALSNRYYLEIDCLRVSVNEEHIFNEVNATNFNYTINSILYTENVTMNLINSEYIWSQNGIMFVNLNYSISSLDLENRLISQEMIIPSGNLTFTLSKISFNENINFSYVISFSENFHTVPSIFGLKINGNLINDDEMAAGSINLIDYPEKLIFTGTDEFLIFNYNITSYFSYSFELDVLSSSYLKKTLLLDSEHPITISNIQYLFDSDIKHSYLNNVDYSSQKSFNPNYDWEIETSIKLEVILDDSVYLPLVVANNTQTSANSSFTNVIEGFSDIIRSNFYPATVTCSFSDVIGFTNSEMLELTYLNNTVTEIEGIESFDSLKLTENDSDFIEIESVESEYKGHFKGVNTFKGDEIRDTYESGDMPSNMDLYDYSTGIDRFEIADELYHKNVFKKTDLSGEYGDMPYLEILNDTTSFVEYYFLTSDAFKYNTFRISNNGIVWQGGTDVLYYYIIQNDLKIYNGASQVILNDVIDSNMWYIFRFEFDFVNNQYDFYLNETQYADNYAFSSAANSIDSFVLYTESAPSYYHCIDSFSYDYQEYETNDLADLETEKTINTTLYCEFGDEIDFEKIYGLNISLNAFSNIESDSGVNISMYNHYLDEFDYVFTINDSSDERLHFEESIYENLYINESLGVSFLIEGYSDSLFSACIDLLNITIHYFEDSVVTELTEMNFLSAGIFFNDILIETETLIFDITEEYEFEISTLSICYFDLNISINYTVDNNAYQEQNEVSTEETEVDFNFYFKANRNFNNWYYSIDYDIISYTTHYQNSLIDCTVEGNSYYFSESLENNSIVYVSAAIDPNFLVSSSIIENNGTYCKLEVSVLSDLELENVSVVVKDFQDYFDNWNNEALQDEFSKDITFFVSSLNESNIFYLEGVSSVPIAEYSYFKNDLYILDQFHEDLEVGFSGYLEFSKYSEAFELQIQDNWITDNVHYGTRSFAIENNIIFVEGWNQDTTSAFLNFTTNPVISYEVTQNSTSILIEANISLPSESVYLIFPVADLESFEMLNSSLKEIYSLNGSDYFGLLVNLDDGMNTFEFKFVVYEIGSALPYLIPIAVVGVALFAYSYYKKWKSDKDEAEKEKTKKANAKKEERTKEANKL